MALMWPRALPPEIRDHPLRAAERKVYERLAESLDGSWVVFYSRPWLGLTPTGEEIDGECDFVVARADSGFLALEVKGGAVSHNPATGTWTSRDRHGFRHKIKNPVAQARSSKYELLRKLKESPAWRPRRARRQSGWLGATIRMVPPGSAGGRAQPDRRLIPARSAPARGWPAAP